MKKKSPSNPFDDLMYLRDSVFVTELKKLVVPACRDFSEHGTFDTSVFHDMCALGGAMVCAALIARHEDIGRFAAALDAKQGVEAAVGECPIFSLGYRDEVCKEAQSIRHYIDVLPDRVTKKRRTLRARLAQKQVRPPIKEKGLLHRAKSTKRAFSDAIFFTDGDTVTLKQLVQSLFEMDLVNLSQVDAK